MQNHAQAILSEPVVLDKEGQLKAMLEKVLADRHHIEVNFAEGRDLLNRLYPR